MRAAREIITNILFPRNEVARLVIAFLMLVAILAGLLLVTYLDWTAAKRFSARVVGSEEIVFDWSEEACEPNDIPDIPARAFRDSSGRVQLIASHYINRRMIGPDFDRLRHDCDVIMPSHYDPEPSRFNDHEWIHSVYTLDGATIFALIHNEYQGHTHPRQCPSEIYSSCWYNAVTLAVSRDGGNSYDHAPPPTHLVASIPYRYVPDAGQIGIFNPSNIVFNTSDSYYYALLLVTRYEAQAAGTCLMRTANLADATSWRAWDGRDFNVRFINPYLESVERPEAHTCQPVSPEEIGPMWHSLTFNTYFNRYLLVSMAEKYDPARRSAVSGVYYSLSEDLIHWAPKKLMIEAELTSTYQCHDPNPLSYASVIDPSSSSRNFETTGKHVYLYFTRFNYESCQMTLDRDLVRVAVEFFK